MIHISDVDKQKWDNGNSYKSITIVFPNISLALDNDDIYGESMTLSEGLFDGNGELCIYGCISSIFTVEVRYKPALANVDFKGQYVAVSMTANQSSSINLFHGFVYGVETVREKKYIKLTCYDRIGIYQDMDVYSAYHGVFENSPIVTVKGMRDTICTYLGITQEVQTLANDMLVITEDESLTELAAINILRAICQINGVFGIINRDGKMEYRKVSVWAGAEPYPSNDLYPSADLYPGDYSGDTHEYIDVYKSLGYQDYNVEEIDRVVVRDSSNDPESGAAASALPFTNALLIEGNMLVTGKDSIAKADIAHNILDNVDYITYRPFEATNRGYPYIEVGDSVSYYSALDHALFTFSVLKRELKGVQWLEDRYNASGSQYQPEVKYDAQITDDINNIKNQIEDIEDEIDRLQRNKQNYIEKEILIPTETAEEGDLQFWDVPGLGSKNLYRYENDEWNLVKWIGQNNSPPSVGDDLDVMFENDGSNIVNIWQKVNGSWFHLELGNGIDYSTSPQDTGLKWMNGKIIWQVTLDIGNISADATVDTRFLFVERLISCEGNATANGGQIVAIDNENMYVDNSGYFHVNLGGHSSMSGVYVTLRYTKQSGAYEFDADYSQTMGQAVEITGRASIEQFLQNAFATWLRIGTTIDATNKSFITNNVNNFITTALTQKTTGQDICAINLDYDTDAHYAYIIIWFGTQNGGNDFNFNAHNTAEGYEYYSSPTVIPMSDKTGYLFLIINGAISTQGGSTGGNNWNIGYSITPPTDRRYIFSGSNVGIHYIE